MGAIQSAINQAGGAIMTGAIAAGHLTEKMDAKKEAAVKKEIEARHEIADIATGMSEVATKEILAVDKAEVAHKEYTQAKNELDAFKAEKHSRHTEGEKKGKFMSKKEKEDAVTVRQKDVDKLRIAAEESDVNLNAIMQQKVALSKRFELLGVENNFNVKNYKKYGYKDVQPLINEVFGTNKDKEDKEMK